MDVDLRDPNVIMKLSRLGSFHQSKLSFLRSFLDEFKDWDYKRDLFDLDSNGLGVAIYSFKKKERVYSLICFANKINDGERSDRVIATKWDAAFTLHDGTPNKKDIDRKHQVKLAFGAGAHHCLGASLARAELQEALTAFVELVPAFRLTSPVLWKPLSMGIWGPAELHIAIEKNVENIGKNEEKRGED